MFLMVPMALVLLMLLTAALSLWEQPIYGSYVSYGSYGLMIFMFPIALMALMPPGVPTVPIGGDEAINVGLGLAGFRWVGFGCCSLACVS